MRLKSKKVCNVSVHGWHGEGASKKLAELDAVRQIEEAAEGYWSPTVLCYRGLVGVAWREPSGWAYTIARPADSDGLVNSSCHMTGGKEECLRSMRSHLAQNGFANRETQAPDILTDPASRHDFEVWANWQNHYAAYRVDNPNATADECWHAACALQAKEQSAPREAVCA